MSTSLNPSPHLNFPKGRGGVAYVRRANCTKDSAAGRFWGYISVCLLLSKIKLAMV